MTIDQLVKGALRKLGALATGQDIDPSEAQDALDACRQMYLDMVGEGRFGRQIDAFVPSTATDFTAREAARYTVENLRDIQISLPEVTRDCWWRWDLPYGAQWVPPALATQPYSGVRPPRDGALITATDLSSEATRTYVYDSGVGRWVSLQDLNYGDTAPLTSRYGDGLMCELAIKLQPEYGQGDPPGAVVLGAARNRSAMSCRWDGPRSTVVGTYF